MSARLLSLEQKLGTSLPQTYVEFLLKHHAKDEVGMYVSSNPEHWGVRTLFEIGEGSKNYQLDEVYRLVSDVLPPESLPVAEDWSGNLYLLICGGPLMGHVVWWNHERGQCDLSVESVANSFSAFLESLEHEKT
jgi:hypothetical protein